MICKNFWCKATFENTNNLIYDLCPYCRTSEDFPGQVEVVKENISLGYSLKELMDLLNSKKNNNSNNNKTKKK